MKKRILIIVLCIVVLITAWTAFCGYQWSWGPFAKLHDVKTASLPGNAAAYSPEAVEQVQGSVLERLSKKSRRRKYGPRPKGRQSWISGRTWPV